MPGFCGILTIPSMESQFWNVWPWYTPGVSSMGDAVWVSYIPALGYELEKIEKEI